MLEFSEGDFIVEEPKPASLIGLHENMLMPDYRNAEGLGNSDLQMFDVNPASFAWVKSAPSDPTKETASEYGTALHTALLEPELLDEQILVSDFIGRASQGFIKFQREHKDKIVLTESEHDQINLITESAHCEPMFSHALKSEGPCESSIFVTDPNTGLQLKIRPDKIITGKGKPMFCDVKSTASIDDWRQDKPWLNPLFKFGYGFTAAYYLHVGSIHYGVELEKYTFLVVSKSASMGKYPVSVFIITKEELIEYGFWDQMINAIDTFKVYNDKGSFMSYEKFPKFYIPESEEVEIKFVEE